MSTATNPSPVAKPPSQTGPEVKKSTKVRSMIGIVVFVVFAVTAALMFGLFHGLGAEESLLIMLGAALLIGGVVYTVQSFLRSGR